jgi:hypothetical protein
MTESERLRYVASQIPSIAVACMDLVARLRLRTLADDVDRLAGGEDEGLW